jgi:hypothetical protein
VLALAGQLGEQPDDYGREKRSDNRPLPCDPGKLPADACKVKRHLATTGDTNRVNRHPTRAELHKVLHGQETIKSHEVCKESFYKSRKSLNHNKIKMLALNKRKRAQARRRKLKVLFSCKSGTCEENKNNPCQA